MKFRPRPSSKPGALMAESRLVMRRVTRDKRKAAVPGDRRQSGPGLGRGSPGRLRLVVTGRARRCRSASLALAGSVLAAVLEGVGDPAARQAEVAEHVVVHADQLVELGAGAAARARDEDVTLHQL